MSDEAQKTLTATLTFPLVPLSRDYIAIMRDFFAAAGFETATGLTADGQKYALQVTVDNTTGQVDRFAITAKLAAETAKIAVR